MKQKTILLLSVFICILSQSFTALAQPGKYGHGEDSINCVKYLSFYKGYMDQKNITEAAPLWRKAIAVCPPTANQNMLLDGMKILRRDIGKYRNNPIRRKSLVDSLMWLHAVRIENYPKYLAQAKINQSMDKLTYMEKGEEKETFNLLGETMDIVKEKTPIVIAVRYMDLAKVMFTDGTMSAEEVMNAFQKSSALLEAEDKAKPSPDAKGALKDVENIFMTSGVATCENLVALFKPRYEANPVDKELLGNMVSIFSASNCMEEDLFRLAVESLHKVEPSYKSAYLLYKLYAGINDVDKAQAYINEAIAYPESDNEVDAEYYFEVATYFFKKAGRPDEAVKAAKESAALSQNFAGKAYFLIGTAWGMLKCQGNEVDTRAQYWVAVDYLIKAKNADSSLTEEANNMINQYTQYFPKQSVAFMYDVLDGSTYTVSCGGMRENTKVRTQK